MKHEVTEVTESVSLMAKQFGSIEPPASPIPSPPVATLEHRPRFRRWGPSAGPGSSWAAGLSPPPVLEAPGSRAADSR